MDQSIWRKIFAIKWLQGARKLFWSLAALALVFDQLTKWLLWSHPAEGHSPVVLIPNVLRIIPHPGNPGGALGLPGSPMLYAVAALVVLPFIGYLFLTTPAGEWRGHAGLGLIGGGAVGNLIDRLSLGVVRDFIDLHWAETFHWPTFNVADAAICFGVALVLWQFLLTGRPEEEAGAANSD